MRRAYFAGGAVSIRAHEVRAQARALHDQRRTLLRVEGCQEVGYGEPEQNLTRAAARELRLRSKCAVHRHDAGASLTLDDEEGDPLRHHDGQRVVEVTQLLEQPHVALDEAMDEAGVDPREPQPTRALKEVEILSTLSPALARRDSWCP